ncbi:MAG: DUF4387 domain-containing protein [Ardenticatenaceae bacterium]|nr:DUF4387 domain-containing protein [Ardenticatenaceae bacterium]HBY97602.1 DUF4387 domain-containing protein [Chloroflexota bacterium]
MHTTATLGQIAHTIRSKNAGAHFYSFDIMFTDPRLYQKVKAGGALTRERIARAYGVPADRITHLIAYDPGLAFKITMRRPVTSGDIGETDVYGSQQYIPLLDIEIPWDDA